MDFSYVGERYNELSNKEKDTLIDNIIDSLMFVNDEIQFKIVSYIMKADKEMGQRIERGLNY